MHSAVIEYIFLILIILALVMLANKLRLPYPIVLVVGEEAIVNVKNPSTGRP